MRGVHLREKSAASSVAVTWRRRLGEVRDLGADRAVVRFAGNCTAAPGTTGVEDMESVMVERSAWAGALGRWGGSVQS